MIFIPMSYGVAYMIAKRIFGDARLEISLFMVLYAVLQQYGYVSVYTASTFLLFRIWQGKAMLANVFLPCLLLLGDTALKKRFKENSMYFTVICLAGHLLLLFNGSNFRWDRNGTAGSSLFL